ncbi:MAG: glycosyltransferase family 2 protein [Caldilineaceae bacterium]|nr:glycosyltransferase family 2 protein [Caldilineaceae bacterium]
MADPPVVADANANVYPLWVVILNWNLPEETIACVRSLLASVPPPGDVYILVVDNGSCDDSIVRLSAAFGVGQPDAAIHLLETGTNLGFAGGVNAGARFALAQGAASVLLLNNDTLVDPAMVSYLAAALAGDPAAGLAGPAIYYHAAPARLWRFGDNEQTWLPIPRRIPDAVAAGDGAPLAVDYITACAMLVRRAVFERIGFLDESFFFYFEDADFCRRARDAGFGIRGVPRAKMWHKVSLSAQRARATTYYSGAWARVQFYRRHPHGKLPWLVHPYLWGRALIASVGHLARGERALLGPLWRGMVDGYTDSITAKGAKGAKKREEGKKMG